MIVSLRLAHHLIQMRSHEQDSTHIYIVRATVNLDIQEIVLRACCSFIQHDVLLFHNTFAKAAQNAPAATLKSNTKSSPKWTVLFPVHPPGVEPGARPWEDPMLPLHHCCMVLLLPRSRHRCNLEENYAYPSDPEPSVPLQRCLILAHSSNAVPVRVRIEPSRRRNGN